MRKALILAAGLGTRLRPITDNLPKPMVPIGGKPLLERLARLLAGHGVREIAVNLHFFPEVVLDHFKGLDCGAALHFAVEPELLGTAGACNNFPGFFDEPFFVLYGDVFTTADLTAMAAFHRQKGGAATIGLYRVDNPTECGLVDMDASGRVSRFVEKPPVAFTDLANAGIYALEPDVLALVPKAGFSDFGKDVFPKMLLQNMPMYGYAIKEYLIDIGSKTKYEKANRDFADMGLD